MASLTYVDEADRGDSGLFVEHSVSDLESLILEPADHEDGLRKVQRLAQLLLLSNNIEQAYRLICALCQHHKSLSASSKNAQQPFRLPTRPFANFWESYPEYVSPEEQPDSNGAPTRQTRLAMEQWHEFRECTRTGWMKDHCGLAEPEDPHVWKDTDDAPTIAMCARLLAKNQTLGQYPSLEAMREALAAAKKLYAQPQVPITEWKSERNGSQTVRRHSYLLYRRLVVELAIRVGDLEYAAETLSLGLRLDGFNTADGGQVDRYLFIPDIYQVLPLLAERGKEGNPFFIGADDAAAIVERAAAALDLRAREGRQWSLAADKVGWKELLDRLARAAFIVNREGYERNGITCVEDILHPPATEEAIAEAESRVGELSPEFKEMVRVANGFEGGWHFLAGGLAGVEEVGLAHENGVEEYLFAAPFEDLDADILSRVISLPPATDCDEFYHFMISPAYWPGPVDAERSGDGEYPYWHLASWDPSEDVWRSLRDWIASEVENAETMVKKGKTLGRH